MLAVSADSWQNVLGIRRILHQSQMTTAYRLLKFTLFLSSSDSSQPTANIPGQDSTAWTGIPLFCPLAPKRPPATQQTVTDLGNVQMCCSRGDTQHSENAPWSSSAAINNKTEQLQDLAKHSLWTGTEHKLSCMNGTKISSGLLK